MKYKKWIITIVIVSLLIGLTVYKVLYVNPHLIKIREETIKSDKLSNTKDGIIIAYFSDTHLNNYTNNDDLLKVVELINSVKPDVVLFGGDLIDNYVLYGLSDSDRAEVIDGLSKINAKLGKYAVLGEHDSNKTEIEQILNDSDFEVITNTNKQIYYGNSSYFNLVGIDCICSGLPDTSLAYDGVNSEAYTIVLTHAPDIFDDLYLNQTDLVLAGHSHGPQIYVPFFEMFYRIDGAKKYSHGKHTKQGTTLDITNGVGLSENSTRFNSNAEVVFYKLLSSN